MAVLTVLNAATQAQVRLGEPDPLAQDAACSLQNQFEAAIGP